MSGTTAVNVPAANQFNASVAAGASLPNVATMGPDAVLAFCGAQMNSLDSQLQQEMAMQQAQGALSAQWTNLQALLEPWNNGSDASSNVYTSQAGTAGQASMAQQLMAQYGATTDPALQAKIAAVYMQVTGAKITDAIAYASNGSGNVSDAVSNAGYWAASGPDSSGNYSSTCLGSFKAVDGETWNAEVAGIKDAGSTISQGSDLDMINIQNLVSQRQQVIELSTQMMQSFQEGDMKAIGNIGGQ